MYEYNPTKDTERFALDFKIMNVQADLILNYMHGSDYGIAVEDSILYRFDYQEMKYEQYTIKEAVEVIREWLDDMVQEVDAAAESTDDYTLDNMKNEQEYNNYVGGIYGSLEEREEKRRKLLLYKTDDLELAKLI